MPIATPELLQFGIAGLLFVVWVYTFKYFSRAVTRVSDNSNETIKQLASRTSNAYQAAIDDGKIQNKQLIDLDKELIDMIRENAKEEQQTKAHLIRVLTRIEEKLDQPIRCPAAILTRKGEDR